MAWIEYITVPFQAKRTIRIHAAADFQITPQSLTSNNSQCDIRMVKSWIKDTVSDKDGIAVILGDCTDDDRPSTRNIRRAAFADRERREVMTNDAIRFAKWLDDEIIPLFLPLGEMPLGFMGMLAGHHWYDLESMTSAQYICMELSKKSKRPFPYLGEMSAWVWLKFKGAANTAILRLIHVQHGVGSSQAVGSALKKLEKARLSFDGDAFIRAHDTAREAAKIDVIGPRYNPGHEPKLKHRTIPLLNIGSATRSYTLTKDKPTYSEQAMMRPNSMGWGTLIADVERVSKSEDEPAPWDVQFRVEM